MTDPILAECLQCGQRFEIASDAVELACPRCQSPEIQAVRSGVPDEGLPAEEELFFLWGLGMFDEFL